MKSMTAFSNAEKIQENFEINVEVRSYNSRYLDISLRISPAYLVLEERIKLLISEKVTRGRVEMKLQISESSQEPSGFEINQIKAEAYYNALVQLKDMFDLEGGISLKSLLGGTGGIIKPVESKTETEARWPVIKDCVTQALENLDAMRKQEGDYIARDFVRRLDYMEDCANEIEKKSSGLLPIYQERLKERIAALTGGITEADPGRIAQEAAFLADKSDISEEIVRTGSHIRQFQGTMNAAEPSGRKLNFLLQELNREFNTMGAKAGNAEISHMIVNVKSELEKIREQVQNVE